ncbi:MAG: NAD-dependent succinate-semialdehyde dehydrogenase [Myxococcales bacterium]
MSIQSIDPRSGEVRRRFPALDSRAIDEKLTRSSLAFAEWRHTSFHERTEPMLKAAELLDAESAELGRTITLEMGKPLAAAVAEVRKCAAACRYYAQDAEKMLVDDVVTTEAETSYVHYLPLGPVLAIMPWNFPFWQVFRFVAPTLMAGNVGLLKHASNVPLCALAIEDLLHRAGFPEGVFQTLLIGSDAVARVLEDKRVVAVTLTGSTSAGALVAAAAGKVVKPSVLELGGSDPFIVMPSADLDQAVQVGVASRILNNGQSCINAKRFIIHREVYDTFAQRMVAAFEALRVGDPLESETEVGPLALASVRDDVSSQVVRSLNAGARCLTGATGLERAGWWFQPGVLDRIPESSPAFREELFGPVALLFCVSDVDAAIKLANRSEFGLGSSIWTNERAEQRRFINELETGQTFVNAMVVSDPRLPFGGVKCSGYGRELGVAGIRAFVNAKTVYIAPARPKDSAATE